MTVSTIAYAIAMTFWLKDHCQFVGRDNNGNSRHWIGDSSLPLDAKAANAVGFRRSTSSKRGPGWTFQATCPEALAWNIQALIEAGAIVGIGPSSSNHVRLEALRAGVPVIEPDEGIYEIAEARMPPTRSTF